MRKLAQDIGQSCHIAVASEDQIVVITRIERPGRSRFLGAHRLSARDRDAPLRAWCCSRTRTTRCAAPGSSAAGSRAKPPNLRRARGRGPRARPPRSGVAFRAWHRRSVGAHPARRHRGRGAHHSRSCTAIRCSHGNGAGGGVRARRGAADIRAKSCTEIFHERRDDGQDTQFITPGYLGATILVVALFFILGHVQQPQRRADPAVPQDLPARRLRLELVQFAAFIGYFVFAIPASLFMRRFGYRAAVVMGLVLFGTGALLFYPAAQFGEYHCVPRRAVRGRERPVVPRDLRESHDRRHGSGRKRRPAAELRADVQSRSARSSACSSARQLILSDITYTPEQFAAHGACGAAPRGAPPSSPPSNYPTSASPAWCCSGRCWSPSRNSRPSTRARGGRCASSRRRLPRPRGVSALLAGRVRAVRVRGRAGGRVELPDPLHAVQFSGHRRKGRAAQQSADHARAVLRRAASSARC